MLEFAVTGGRVLASMVRTSRPHVRAYHPAGMADPEGFAGMGCHEALLHGNDIAEGFGLSLDPPRDVCRRLLARLFPQATADLAGSDPWTALLWAGGWIELPATPGGPACALTPPPSPTRAARHQVPNEGCCYGVVNPARATPSGHPADADALHCFEECYGRAILQSLSHARRFNKWMVDVIEPYLGTHILEIGSGLGNISRHLPEERR